jgi:phenylalanyl-tRNA synthetase beta chain
MKLSFDWLSDYVDLSGISPAELAQKLTMGAFEVEEVVKVGGLVEGPIVVGEILEIYPHPNADKIRLTKTRIEKGAEPLEIVCGASNIEVGQRIPVALPGASVLDRKEGKPYKLVRKEVRGVVSNGMLCSASELGLPAADDEGGILILSKDDDRHEIGKDVQALFELHGDYVLHVEPRSNRGDALSVIGLAREIAALLNRPLKHPSWDLSEFSKQSTDKNLQVTIDKTEDCSFFSICAIHKVKGGKLPTFMTRRLEAVGVRSVSPLVDITNYVMHELGQPLHAYDLDKVAGNAINVRRARAGECLETIDGKKRDLSEDVLVIADSKTVLGVAGVMGGKDSEISDTSSNIALEAAAFGAARVRRSSRLLGLSSDASLRFERGVDAASSLTALNRATYLILKYLGGDAQTEFAQCATAGSDVTKTVHVDLRVAQLKRLLAIEFSAEQVTNLIAPLGFVKTGGDDKKLTFSIPSFRQTDVYREIDLLEEVCRLWGYDRLPSTMPASTVAAAPFDSTIKEIVHTLTAYGMDEAWLSSLTRPDFGKMDNSSASAEMGKVGEDEEAVYVLNPLSADHQVLRRSLLPGLILAAAYNTSRGQQRVRLFELGRIYEKSEKSPYGTGVIEPFMVGGILLGNQNERSWQQVSDKNLDFYQVKGIVENLLRTLNIDIEKIRFAVAEKTNPLLHPARSCQVVFASKAEKQKDKGADNGQRGERGPRENLQTIGWLGEIHPRLADKQDFRIPAYLFELNVDIIKTLKKTNTFKGVATTPSLHRDLTVDIADTVDFSAVHSCLMAESGKILQDVDLISTFALSEGQKSLSFRLRLQDKEKTLTNEEVDALLAKLRNSLARRVGATFRV